MRHIPAPEDKNAPQHSYALIAPSYRLLSENRGRAAISEESREAVLYDEAINYTIEINNPSFVRGGAQKPVLTGIPSRFVPATSYLFRFINQKSATDSKELVVTRGVFLIRTQNMLVDISTGILQTCTSHFADLDRNLGIDHRFRVDDEFLNFALEFAENVLLPGRACVYYILFKVD